MARETIDYEDALRRLTVNDRRYVRAILADSPQSGADETVGLTDHLVRLGALIALDAGTAEVDAEVADALAAGASRSDVVSVLLTVAPFVGSARLVGAAPRIAEALDFDVFAELQRLPGPGE